jgi:hypothetical protein
MPKEAALFKVQQNKERRAGFGRAGIFPAGRLFRASGPQWEKFPAENIIKGI